MIGQSFAIIAVILAMELMFLRTGRKSAAIFALPCISASMFHLIGIAMDKLLRQSTYPTDSLHIVFDVAGLFIGVVLCWVLSCAITVKKLRYVYFVSCAVFLALLTVAYINYHINIL